MNQVESYQGEVVYIAGGTGIVGAILTRHFALCGANVVAFYFSEAEMAALRGVYPDATKDVYFQRLDALDEKQVTDEVKKLAESRGVPTILVNLIGGYSKMTGTPQESNLAPFRHFAQAVFPLMAEKNRGKIINTTSCMGLKNALPGQCHTLPGIAEVLAYTKELCFKANSLDIQVNHILTNHINTPPNRQDFPEEDHDLWVEPDELVDVIDLLASPPAKILRGSILSVFGQD